MLNPITYTERVIADFLRYQLTAYPFADERLRQQMRDLLSLDETRNTPLLKGPYVSLSRPFRSGARVSDLVSDGIFHPHMTQLAPYESLWGHQERAIRAVATGRNALVSTGTGSGKTECFLYPVISTCLELRDKKAGPGIVAVFVYPMNALAEDQLGRLRGLLAGTVIPFGMYVGKTPETAAGVSGTRLPNSASRADYEAALKQARDEAQGTIVHPAEELASREELRARPPRILLTNVKQLELLLTRQRDADLFVGADLRFLVFDEAHTYRGADGAETACLIRRLRSYCGRDASQTVCIGTSATLVDPSGDRTPALEFASRFFGVPEESVELVTEEHEDDDWPDARSAPSVAAGSPANHLERVLDALEAANESPGKLGTVLQDFAGLALSETDWLESLYDSLSENEICFQLAQELKEPQPLDELAERVSEKLGREVAGAEILTWLALGAAARRNGRPLLRSIVHAFASGIGSAAVSFPEDTEGPRLWLSGRDEESAEAEDALFRLPVTTCSTCGQHYFVHHVTDLRFQDGEFAGGDLSGENRVWKALGEERGGARLVLLNALISDEEDEDPEDPHRTRALHFCRHCGALHANTFGLCLGCGRETESVRLLAFEYGERRPGYLTSCLSCAAPGRLWGSRYREPARPVRAVTVSDVHVLAQNMLHHADRKRLLMFADNRQEAAFQAGWMRDHARRFRLRALMYEEIREDTVSIGDLVARLDRILDSDAQLSRALIPEVWEVARKQAGAPSREHEEQRKRYLRIQVLRELATGVKQRLGLEPWGRMRVEYFGLEADLDFFQRWAPQLGVTPERLVDGVAALLDSYRRKMILADPEGCTFSRWWMEGDFEIQRGYMPLFKGIPKGLKLSRGATDDERRIVQWLSNGRQTLARQAVVSWGVDKDMAGQFLEELWELLADQLGLLAPVTLTGSRGGTLPGTAGARQIDADRLTITPHKGRWRCGTCRRAQVRPTPHDACLAWNCGGTLSFEQDNPDDYDLRALEEGFAMLRPHEHSAQVPNRRREELEERFKGDGEGVNALVCTPTLELGVDIGGLDTVLLRNVPPLPANYWQRVGRAGRRHRLAVNLTYVRPTTHDRAYFGDPLKLLRGRIEPPRFNLKNEVMLDKHVRSSILTRLHQLGVEGAGLSDFDREEIAETLDAMFPTWVGGYLFEEDGRVRSQPFDVSPLRMVITKHEAELSQAATGTFSKDWPREDADAVEPDRLREVVLGMPDALDEVVGTFRKRLNWARRQIERLDQVRSEKGALDPDEDQLFRRCDDLIKRLKGVKKRSFHEAEGYDDRYTLGALAAEGFLPGYGLETGTVLAMARMPHIVGRDDFALPRPPALALREYVPGNLIYADGHRFIARIFHFDPGEQKEPIRLTVDVEHGSVREVGTASDDGVATIGTDALTAVAITDVDLVHRSRITDDEEHRFQLPVAVEGYERERHGEGAMYAWGERDLSFRRGVHLRLVNLGAAYKVGEGTLGYPLSLTSGQSRSPLASDTELANFEQTQLERYGKKPEWVGFYADTVADTLSIPNCADREEAHSVLEAIRIGMRQVLDMELEDLQTLVIGTPGSDAADALLYDPMPGGSGLLEHALARWNEVVAAAMQVLGTCESACERACQDCMWTYRNQYVHRHLDRHRALSLLHDQGREIVFSHPIPAKLPETPDKDGGVPVNKAEDRLKQLLSAASLPGGTWQKQIKLGRPLGSTTPDVFFEIEDEPGVCVYLDGLSDHIHGNPETKKRDQQIRETLRSRHYEVVEIAASHLEDKERMSWHFKRLARILIGKDKAKSLAKDTSWFSTMAEPSAPYQSDAPVTFEVAESTPEDGRSDAEPD